MSLDLYTYGMDIDPITLPSFDASWNLHTLGVKLFDTNGHTQRIQAAITRKISMLLGDKHAVRVAIQCKHGLHRSVEMATSIGTQFAAAGMIVNYHHLAVPSENTST